MEVPSPLRLEWLPGANSVGDFNWPGCGRAVVKADVFQKIAQRFPAVKSEAIEMFQAPRLRMPKRTERAKPRVWLPYEGPALLEMIPVHRAAEHENTTWRMLSRCRSCKQEERELDGFGRKDAHWDATRAQMIASDKARERGKGLFVAKAAVGDTPIFSVAPFLSWIFCTDDFKQFAETEGLTNIDFVEYGEIVT